MAILGPPLYTVEHAFTITLNPKYYNLNATEQYDISEGTVLRRLNDISDMHLIVAEYTKSFNIHYHGIIKFRLIKGKSQEYYYKQFHDVFRNIQIFGHKNIKPVSDNGGWLDYMRKDLKGFKELVNREPIISDSFNYFTTEEILNYLRHPKD